MICWTLFHSLSVGVDERILIRIIQKQYIMLGIRLTWLRIASFNEGRHETKDSVEGGKFLDR
jgi:hypothetical protein